MEHSEQAKAFYKSKAWRKTRKGYMTSQHYICERCKGVGVICHHKVYINAENVMDPYITLDWNNLECLCMECHNQEHFKTAITRDGLYFDADGNLMSTPR